MKISMAMMVIQWILHAFKTKIAVDNAWKKENNVIISLNK